MFIPRANLTFLILLISLILHDAYGQVSRSGAVLDADKLRVEQLISRAEDLAAAQSDSCLVYTQEARRLARAYQAPDLEARAVFVAARYYFDSENYPDALVELNLAMSIHTQTGDSTQKALAYDLAGLTNYYLGNYDDALSACLSALRLAVAQGDSQLMARSYRNMGMLNARLGNNTEALNYFSQSVDLFRAVGNRGEEAGVLHETGQIYTSLLDYQEALGYFLSSLKIYSSEQDTLSMANVFLSVGRVYEALSNWSSSLDYYNMALSIYQRTGNNSGIASSYYGLGLVQKKTGNQTLALDYLLKSLEYYSLVSLIEGQADCHRELAEVYYSLGDNLNAYEEMQDYVELHDQVYNKQTIEKLAEMEIRYKTRLKDNEIAELRSQREEVIRDVNRRNVSIIVIVSLTIVIIIVTLYYTKTLRKANEDLQSEIEERTKAEMELLSIKESLEERVAIRTRELELAKQKAEESDRLKSAFLANMSHEIRTPLNAITGYAGLLLKPDLSLDKRKEYNDLITKNYRLLLNMFEDLIDTSKIESGTIQLIPKKFNIVSLIEQLDEPLQENLISKNKPNLEVIREKVNIRSRMVTTDPVRIQQVMWHLLDNAVKFTDEGKIRYGCFENSQELVFYVNDSGIGIPPEFSDTVFEKFRQLDESSKRKYGGTGLGLYYARKIAEVLGGRVWFESKPEGGSIFYFSIPVQPPVNLPGA